MNPQEFHLSITPLGDDRYLVRTEDMAAGVPVAEAQVQWPVDQWLKRSQPAMDDPILGLLQGRSPAAAHASSDLNALGADLYNALFHQDYIRESWSRAQGIAQNRRQMLRLRLGFKDSRLQRLPWEVLQSGGKPLTTRVDLTFARYSADLMAAQSAHPLNLPEGDEPLRVLMVIANPDDRARLNLRQEVDDIQTSLQPSPGEPMTRVEITVLEQPDRSDLTQALEQGHYQVLHYAGHSDFGQTGGDLHLVNQQTGLTERLTGEDLAGLLVNNQICLAVFNSCRSAHTVGDDAEMDWRQQNLVQALVNRGVQSVIAMAERIPDQVAVKFTQLLYTNIKQGYPIDLSLGRTRQALVSAFGSDQHYWALPVLYLQPEFDGYLTQRDRAAAPPLDPWQIEASTAPTASSTAAETDNSSLEGTTGAVTLLDSLETAQAPDLLEADVNLGQLVEQLSQSTAATDEPPIPADQEEVLWLDSDRQAEPDIYQVLPENPTYQQSQPVGQTLVDRSASPEGESVLPPYRASQPSLTRQKLTETSLLTWVALGAVGLAGTLTLGIFTAQQAGLFSQTTQSQSETPVPAASDAPEGSVDQALLGQINTALADQDYDTANTLLSHALDQGALAHTNAPFLKAVLVSLERHGDPDILFMKGRANWQHYVIFAADPLLDAELTEPEATQQALEAAIQAWERLTTERPDVVEAWVALGFAYYARDLTNDARKAWEKAENLEFSQRTDPNQLADPVVLSAYAGLALLHLDPEIENLDAATAENQQILALESFQKLREHSSGEFEPETLASAVDFNEHPHLWLWSSAMVAKWVEIYPQLDAELDSQSTGANAAQVQ